MATIKDVRRGDRVRWEDEEGVVHQIQGSPGTEGSYADPLLRIHTATDIIEKRLSQVEVA